MRNEGLMVTRLDHYFHPKKFIIKILQYENDAGISIKR